MTCTTIDVKELKKSLDPVRKQNTVLAVTINGDAAVQSLHALVKDYQIHPLRREIIHVDLLAIDPNKEVVAEVPLEFTGKPAGAIHGGQIRTVLRDIEVRAKPSDIPVKLIVDVSPLEIGDVIHVSAIELPAGVSAVSGRDLAVVTCAAPDEDKTAATPGAEAAGAAPAAGAKDAKAAAKAPAAAKPAKK